jgi:soluble lytic murein transglycosylase-like protein
LLAPVPIFAAQIHQESRWRPDAKSAVGALGIAQFMPGTAQWIANLYPADLKPGAPLDPNWAIRALVRYDYWLLKRLSMYQEGDERWAAALAGYNGGLGWVQKDSKLTNCNVWFGCAELAQDGRTEASLKENRGYPERILHVLRPLYVAAGWGSISDAANADISAGHQQCGQVSDTKD